MHRNAGADPDGCAMKTELLTEKGTLRLKGLLMVSAAALVLTTTPAWIPGMAAAILFAALSCWAIWRYVSFQKKEDAAAHSGLVCLSLLICIAFGSNFYNIWKDSRYVQKLAQMLHLPLSWLLGICTAAAVLLCLPAVNRLVTGAVEYGAQDIRECGCMVPPKGKKTVSMKQAVWLLFVVYVIGFSAVLRTNFYYLDDNGRAAFGYKTWDYFGRYLSTGFSTLLHMGDYLVDIAPLPQLAALWILAVASVCLLYVLYDRTWFTGWELAASVILGLNPYFLECLSFRFDAPYMAVSVLAGIVPLLYRRRGTFVYILASGLGILFVCTSYQASAGIFPILVIAVMLQMWNRGERFREIMAFCGRSAAGYGLGMVYFKLVIMKPASAGYVSNAMPEGIGLISHTIDNFKHYYSLILTDFRPVWMILALLTAVVFAGITVHRSRRNKLAAGALTLLCIGLMLLLCFGLYPVLESALFSPRAMYGFGVLLAIFGVSVAKGWGRMSVKLPALLLSWAFFVFSFAYGNALDLQKNYTEFRIQLVMEDLNQLPKTQERMDLRLSGGIGMAPVLGNLPQNYRILNRLIPETFGGGDDLTEYRFYEYYGIGAYMDYGKENLATEEMILWRDTLYHSIYVKDEHILVELK